MQTDSRNHKVNGGASLVRYLAIFSQKSNWKEKPEEKKKRILEKKNQNTLYQVNYRTSKQGLKTGNKLYSKQHETYHVQ